MKKQNMNENWRFQTRPNNRDALSRSYNRGLHHNNRFPERNFNRQTYHNQKTVRASDDETRAYAVNLQLKPVEMGIIAVSSEGENREFRGLMAFHQYFNLIAPENNIGRNLPDVWDGYFHITLAKFFSHHKPDQLDNCFRDFRPSLENLPVISNTVFQCTKINRFSGENRGRDRKNIDFIVLPIDLTEAVRDLYRRLQPLLEQIRRQAQVQDWSLTAVENLHVTIRKYSNFNFNLNMIDMRRYSLQFRCSHLEIRQPRELAKQRCREGPRRGVPWWTGITMIDERCSGCRARISPQHFNSFGFCPSCRNYETVTPVWPTEIQH